MSRLRPVVYIVDGTRVAEGQPPVMVTRYNNHGRPLPDGKWAAHRGEHYALYNAETKRWEWTYKVYTPISTAERAARAAALCDANDPAVRADIAAQIVARRAAQGAS